MNMLLHEVVDTNKPADIDVCYTVINEDAAQNEAAEPANLTDKEKKKRRKLNMKREDMRKMFPFS